MIGYTRDVRVRALTLECSISRESGTRVARAPREGLCNVAQHRNSSTRVSRAPMRARGTTSTGRHSIDGGGPVITPKSAGLR
jgi:hypothetical protein